MLEMYGHQWASQQGDEPNDTWARGLCDLSEGQFGMGLSALLARGSVWPPSLPEFRQLCTGYDPGGWERKCHRIVDPGSLIENKTAKERRIATGLEELAKLRRETNL